jgi:hypothetical protein
MILAIVAFTRDFTLLAQVFFFRAAAALQRESPSIPCIPPVAAWVIAVVGEPAAGKGPAYPGSQPAL